MPIELAHDEKPVIFSIVTIWAESGAMLETFDRLTDFQVLTYLYQFQRPNQTPFHCMAQAYASSMAIMSAWRVDGEVEITLYCHEGGVLLP